MLSLAVFSSWGLIASGCGTSASTLPALVRCELDALKVLPSDPGNATVYDAVDVIERLQACHRHGDAGS